MNDFQHIPPKPQGDAGLDGLSHGFSVAYCCYGPEQEPSKVNARGLAKEIIKKFRSDMRRLFELEPKGKGKKATLAHRRNGEMATILPSGRKITTIRLIVSVLDTHRVLAPLRETFDACTKASQCGYVDAKADMTIWGPAELATIGAVDDATILRLEKRVLLKRVATVLSSPPANTTTPSTSDFDAKFDWIEANGKPRPGAVKNLRTHFMTRWLEALAIENDFANNAVALHHLLSAAREEAAVDAELASGNQASANTLLTLMRQKLIERLEQHLGTKLPPELIGRLADGEVARLIGECPIDWRTVP
ncbi:MAG TPA: hypothetical protein VG963_12290 [Polyangiaceae bacterium]|nr:hypothetical protein [Polyangiaceae bacterium]